ncbi:MAG TPA: DUF3024 domain-containing protein [Agriterribacter sp.]|nr:DUF3024 domain-containing protein [Agriterribacter sp.]
MALDALNTVDIIETMENYVARMRPPEEIRHKLDINYRIDNQSIILFEIRPSWRDKTQYLDHDFAKTTYEKKNSVWKIYWLRANLQWTLYDPAPTVKKLVDFLELVEIDKYGCFKG